jgi:predicted RNA-binding Zn-ribbon protein involved in translation (DUF1610 family)
LTRGTINVFTRKKQEIVNILNTKIKPHCPMCGFNKFTLADSYIRNDLQDDLLSVNLGGPSIPSVAIICTNCGFISNHAIGILDLLPTNETTEEK